MKKRLLIVDDHTQGAVATQQAINALAPDQFEIELAFTGQACLDRLQRAPAPDLILLDIDMPVVSGADIVRAALRMDPAPDFRILPMTAWDVDWVPLWGLAEVQMQPEFQRLVVTAYDKGDSVAALMTAVRDSLSAQ